MISLAARETLHSRNLGSAVRLARAAAEKETVHQKEKRAWLGKRVWIASAENSKRYGRVCSVDHRAVTLASVMVRIDGYRGTVLVEEAARGVKWDFDAD